MKRRYKLLIIILIGTILTIIINYKNPSSTTALLALGDGFSLGMRSSTIQGFSYNDYLSKYFDEFNTDFTKEFLTVHELNEYITTNTGNIPIQQLINNATLITVSIGLDELSQKSLVTEVTNELIDEYLNEIEELFANLRELNTERIIFIGLYEAYNLSTTTAISINESLKKLCGKYNISFIDITPLSMNQDYYLYPDSYYLNYKAHEQIASMIKDII